MEVIKVNDLDAFVLKQKCYPIESADELYQISGMKSLLRGAYNGTGKGLAAPQVGINKRFFLIRFGAQIEVFVNPEITRYGGIKVTGKEGCLSVPGYWYEVERSKKVTVKYFNESMILQEREFNGFDAVAIQHEYDHLNGILICDIGSEAV